jgi:hypothetical protein
LRDQENHSHRLNNKEHAMSTIDITGIPQLSKAATLLLSVLLALAPVAAHARTWTAKTGQRMEGEFIAKKGSNVSVKGTDGKVYAFPITNLVAADQKYVTEQTGAASAVKGGSLAVLTPPFTVKATPITGKGDDRKATLKVTNNSKKSVKGLVLMMYFLKADGSVGTSVPHSQNSFYNLDGGILKKGQSSTTDVSNFFMKDDTAAMAGMVKEATFVDGSNWPALPARPAKNGTDSVAAIVAGVMGKGEQTAPVAACFNYTAKDVKSITYMILYLDGSGKTVGKTGYGYMSDKSIIAPGKGRLITGGDAPPKGAVSARVEISSVEFTDDSKWSPSKKPKAKDAPAAR